MIRSVEVLPFLMVLSAFEILIAYNVYTVYIYIFICVHSHIHMYIYLYMIERNVYVYAKYLTE